MPLSLIIASSANYATAKIEKQTWLADTVIPKAKWMAEEINRKLMVGTDYKFEFRYEQKSEMQEEERERALAYRLYVNADMLPSVAAQVVGIDLPPDVEFEDLDRMKEEIELRKHALEQSTREAEELGRGEEFNVPLSQAGDAPVAKAIDVVEPAPALTMDQLRELDLWQQIAFRKFKRGEGLDFPFVEKSLDSAAASLIRDRLTRCRTEDEIRAAFDVNAHETKQADLMALAEAINRAADAMITEPAIME